MSREGGDRSGVSVPLMALPVASAGGLVLGVVLGILIGNVALGIGVGVAGGLCTGAVCYTWFEGRGQGAGSENSRSPGAFAALGHDRR